MMKSISVIIPTFNDNVGVRECLQAVAQQSYSKEFIEVIVVDNGSTPPLRVKSHYPFNLRVVRCLTPGSYAARNAGSAIARGEVLAFTDADCSPHADWLRSGVQGIVEGEGKWVLGGDVLFLEAQIPLSTVALYQCTTGFGQEGNVREKGFAATANLFCTREQFERTGPFDERLLSGGDREWTWRATTLGFLVRFQPDAVVYTRPRATLSSAIRQARRVAAGRMMLRELQLDHIGQQAVAKQRTAWESVYWILTRPSLSGSERIRVLCVALLIRGVSIFERLRLEVGVRPERR